MKIFSIGLPAMVAVAFLTMSCDKESTIQPEKLPNTAQDFLGEHFNANKILSVTEEKEGLSGKEFTAILDDGTKITFDKNGQWIEAEAPERTALPTSFILSPIKSYVETNHATAPVSTIEKEKHGFDVELTNDLDLVFDKAGKFLRYQD